MKVITEIDHAHLDIYVFITLLALHILYIWCSRIFFGIIYPVATSTQWLSIPPMEKLLSQAKVIILDT
jgi:hypothetical protein